MDDQTIIDLYWQRSEQAIEKTEEKYGPYCRSIAYNVLSDREDARECVNDTYLAAWKALPPHRPSALQAFLAKLTRRISIDHWRASSARKRGGGQVPLVLEELADCASPEAGPEAEVLRKEAIDALNRLLDQLPKEERIVFLRRYFYLDRVTDIAASLGCTDGRITAMLRRTRTKLRDALRKEGYL